MSIEYRLADDVVFREVPGGAVLLSTRSGAYHQVNRTGTRVLSLLQEEVGVVAILEQLETAYPSVEPEQLAKDVYEMLDSLTKAGVVRHE